MPEKIEKVVDSKGTQPGLVVPVVTRPKEVNMRCRRPNCDSMRTIEVTVPGLPPGRHLYQCVECKHTWGINLGGPVEF